MERTFLGPSGDFSVHLLTRAHPQHQVVKEHFLQKWKKHVSGQPRVQRIYFIRNSPQVHEAFSAVASRIGNVRRRFHGTSQAPGCNFGKNPSTPPCDSSDCRICSIAHHSFRTRCSGQTTASQNGGWLRYGRGLYFSATSGKSNDYSAGSETIRREGDRRGKDWRWRCMFLCKVAVGRPFITTEGELAPDQCPPPNHDSVVGEVGPNLNYDEVVVYRDAQAVPSFLIVYALPI